MKNFLPLVGLCLLFLIIIGVTLLFKDKLNKKTKRIVIDLSIICLSILCLYTLYLYSGDTKKDNKPEDTNLIKAYCVFDAYTKVKNEDGHDFVTLEGNSNKTKLSVDEGRDNSRTQYYCENIENKISNLKDVNYNCDTGQKTASNGGQLYSYKLKYDYVSDESILNNIKELEQKDYECIIYYNKEDSVSNKSILGSWCGVQTLLGEKTDIKITFNEDGTGNYSYGKSVNYDFYYSINDNKIKYFDTVNSPLTRCE